MVLYDFVRGACGGGQGQGPLGAFVHTIVAAHELHLALLCSDRMVPISSHPYMSSGGMTWVSLRGSVRQPTPICEQCEV